MALELRKLARLPIPAGPMNLSRWGGRALSPRLFVALYFYCSIYSNSSRDIKCGVGSCSGVCQSGSTSSLKKISLLKEAKALIGMGLSLLFRYLSICQNCFGQCLRMFGRSVCIRALLLLQTFLKCWYASLVRVCFFPCSLFTALYSLLASLHTALNHGAMCLAHLFGFL